MMIRLCPRACTPGVVLVSVVSLAACDLGDVPLGGDDTDGFSLRDPAPFQHIAAALDGGDSLSVRDLFERGDGLVFSSTPNPATLLSATNALDDTRARAGRAPLSVLSYNVALLDVDLFGFVPYAESPHLPDRRHALPGLIFSSGADVVLLQEVWLDEDVDGFSRRGEALGYRPFVHPREGHNDGLMTFIREDIIAGGSTTDMTFASYASQVGTEYFPGPGIARGWLGVRFEHRDVGTVHAYNTHMQAFPENWLGRAKQARELGIIVRTAVADTDDLLLVGGDFNSGPYYARAEWTAPDGAVADRWLHNAIAYPTLLTYGNLVDAAIMGRPQNDAIADVTLGDTVVNDAGAADEIPGAQEGWCERTPHTTFTATDCNTVYFEQYAGTEYPARLDHVFVNDTDRVLATSSRLVFTEAMAFGDLVAEPSDHYGVWVDLLVSRRE
jgi:endonuclease/exonuclease/phosphatase family metal-dependent hydrolase